MSEWQANWQMTKKPKKIQSNHNNLLFSQRQNGLLLSNFLSFALVFSLCWHSPIFITLSKFALLVSCYPLLVSYSYDNSNSPKKCLSLDSPYGELNSNHACLLNTESLIGQFPTGGSIGSVLSEMQRNLGIAFEWNLDETARGFCIYNSPLLLVTLISFYIIEYKERKPHS